MRVQEFQARLTTLDRQLTDLLEHVDAVKRAIMDETQALRQQMDSMCLWRVVELAQLALKKAERAASNEHRGRIVDIRQKTQEPQQSSRMAAWKALRKIHHKDDCSDCLANEPCAMWRAGIILSDLLILTVCTGRGPWTNELLKEALLEALMAGCGQNSLDKVEQSQLTQAFNKVISFGKTREDFDGKIVGIYGPRGPGQLLETDEDFDMLYHAYSSCSHTSPHHVSNCKASGKQRKAKSSQKPAGPADEKDPQAGPFFTQDGFVHVGESHWLVSQDHKTCPAKISSGLHPSELPIPLVHSSCCVECGFEDPMGRMTMGFKCTKCSSVKTHVPSLCSVAESSASGEGLQDPLMVNRLSVLDPLPETTITFRGEDCPITARRERHSQACHLVSGNKEGRLDDHNQGCSFCKPDGQVIFQEVFQ